MITENSRKGISRMKARRGIRNVVNSSGKYSSMTEKLELSKMGPKHFLDPDM